jgi:hypothetical protein
MTESNQKKTKNSISDTDLDRLLSGLTMNQIRFIIARQECSTDKEAAEAINITPDTVYHWKSRDKVPINEVLQAMAADGLVTALHIRRRALDKAMLVKVAGLDSENEHIRQRSSTEIIEWETGKANQPIEHKGEINIKGYEKVSPDDWTD